MPGIIAGGGRTASGASALAGRIHATKAVVTRRRLTERLVRVNLFYCLADCRTSFGSLPAWRRITSLMPLDASVATTTATSPQ